MKSDQKLLFDTLPKDWEEHWRGMPSYEHKDLTPWRTVKVHVRNERDWREFMTLVNQKIGPKALSIWYPEDKPTRFKGYFHYKSELPDVNPQYPIYIVSKGRWDSRLTSKALDLINVPYNIVIEPQEYDNYSAHIDPAKILVLPFSNLGQGSIPARNWIMEHSISHGAKRHWILDDNIGAFNRFQNNAKCPVADGTIFKTAEDFVDRYTNVALSGFNYRFFVVSKAGTVRPPITLNTRIYSCILIQNDIPYRWRGRYNEDTDLSLRALRDGWCTVLFNVFLADKVATMRMKGGNTDELYQNDGRLKMAQSLQEQHPDIVRITEKWGRPQHHINYKIFKRNKLLRNLAVSIPENVNDYGMNLYVLEQQQQTKDDTWFQRHFWDDDTE